MKIGTKQLIGIGIGVFLLYLAIHYWPGISGVIGAVFSAAVPLIIGCVIAYVINILMAFYERHYFPRSSKKFVIKSRRIVSLLLAIVTLLAILALVIGLVLPQFVSAIMLLIEQIPDAVDDFLTFLEEWGILPENIYTWLDNLFASVDWKNLISNAFDILTSGVSNVMGTVVNAVSSVFSGIVSTLLAIIFSLYLLLGKEKIGSQFGRIMNRYLSTRWHSRISYFVNILNDCFHNYIVGQCMEALILGMLCTIGMLIFQFPYAAMVGALVAVTALIPVAGAYIGAGVGAFMILTVSPMKALLFLIFIVVLQQLEGNIIYPRVVGSSMGLPGIWVLAAVTVGGGIMGIMGMLIGVPLTAALYRILRDDVRRGELAAAKQAAGTAGTESPAEEAAPPVENSAPPVPEVTPAPKPSKKKKKK